METEEPRLFADDAAVAHVGEGLLACTLTRPEWTHGEPVRLAPQAAVSPGD